MKRKPSAFFYLIVIIPLAVSLMLTLPWEPTAETWLYWLFSRFIIETGRFIIPDRSPLYTLYLVLFHIFKFPYSLYFENLLTTSFSLLVLIIFLKKFMGLFLATIGALVWLPFLYISEPPVQKLALAFALLAVIIRERHESRLAHAWFYSLLGVAYLFRLTYAPIIFFFVCFDVFTLLKKSRGRIFTILRPSVRSDWPVFLVVCVYLLFLLFQSSHPWNNAGVFTTRWFPFSNKKIEVLSFYNLSYIQENYWQLQHHDFYFTNKELFGGATTFLGAIRANPQFILTHFWKYVQEFPRIAASLTIGGLRHDISPFSNYRNTILLTFIFIGALMASQKITKLFFFAVIISLLASSTVAIPDPRYMVPLIPIFIISMWWYGKLIANSIFFILPSTQLFRRIHLALFASLTIGLWIASSSGDTARYQGDNSLSWSDIIKIEKLNSTGFSLTSSFSTLSHLTNQCHGIMTLDHQFFGAFMNIPLSQIYDVWEIPPFGHLGDSAYDGLRPDRITCLFVSKDLSSGEGQPTNFRIRYEFYMKPYEDTLISLGGQRYDIPSYGYAVILPETN